MYPRSEVADMELPDVTEVLRASEQILRQYFTEHDTDEVFLSFNGGKDCTVLLDIVINVLRDLRQSEAVASDLKIVYIRTKGPFREIEDFVEQVVDHYGVKLLVTEGEMKETLQRLLDEDGRLKACLMGTRRTDPYSQDLQYMQKTDPSWPQILRVSPLLDWSYHQIWSYILQRGVPYCSLYDQGYTSIGSTQNTWPNPALGYTDCHGRLSYHPAWRLSNASLERAGRGKAPVITSNEHATCKNDVITTNGHEIPNGREKISNGHKENGVEKECRCNGEVL